MVLSCKSCDVALRLGIEHHDDADFDSIPLARRIAAEARPMLDQVAAFLSAHEDCDWSPVAIMPMDRYDRIV